MAASTTRVAAFSNSFFALSSRAVTADSRASRSAAVGVPAVSSFSAGRSMFGLFTSAMLDNPMISPFLASHVAGDR